MKPANLRLTTAAFLLFSYSGIVLGAPDDDARITTIVGLTNIQEIGSTQNINDVNGKAIMANPNPYKVVVVPENLHKLPRGTVLVSNIGNDGTTGTTIVKFNPFPSTGVQFNAAASALQGPADLSFNRDHLLVANSKGGNSVQVLNADGSLATTITDPSCSSMSMARWASPLAQSGRSPTTWNGSPRPLSLSPCGSSSHSTLAAARRRFNS